jgi:hypothetical protein
MDDLGIIYGSVLTERELDDNIYQSSQAIGRFEDWTSKNLHHQVDWANWEVEG